MTTGGKRISTARRGLARRALAGIVLAIVAAGGAFYLATGGGRPDDWVMRQIVAISQTYIVPEMKFERFEFTFPNRATFHNVSFVAPGGLEIIDAEHLTFTLAETPSRGEPIRLGDVRIEGGKLLLARGRTEAEGTFRGLVPFVKTAAVKDQNTVPRETRLSEVLRINRVTLVNFAIEYDDGTGRESMRLDGINFDAAIVSEQDDDGRIWHAVKTSIDRAPLLELHVDGRIDLDSFFVRLANLSLTASLQDETIRALPQDIQAILNEFDARGGIVIDGRGDLPLTDFATATLGGVVVVEDLNLAAKTTRIPIERLETNFALASGIFYLRDLKASLMEGQLTGNASIDLIHPDGDLRASWVATDLSVAEMIRPGHEKKDSPLSGRLSTSGSIDWSPRVQPSDLAGSAEASLEGGNVTAFPALNNLRDALRVFNIVDNTWSDDTFRADLLVDPKGIRSPEFLFTSSAIGGKGNGRINFDGTMDITFSAGPVERFVGKLGALGRVIADAAGQLVRYRVTGSLDDPKVAVQPLGIGK